MKKSKLEKHLAQYTGSEGSYPFGPEALVYKVMGKMFALVSQNEQPARLTLKASPEDVKGLIWQYESVVPGYHMSKKHWVTISLDGEIADSELMDLAGRSYDLICSKLTKADKAKLEQLK